MAMVTLSALSEASQILSSSEPLATRVERCFTLLRNTIPGVDLRLTIYSGSGGIAQHFALEQSSPLSWDEGRVAAVARLRRPVVAHFGAPALPRTLERDQHRRIKQPEETLEQLTYLGLPILWDGRLWGVLEARRMGAWTTEERSLLGALLPLFAAAIAEERWGREYLPSPMAGLSHQQQTLLAAIRRELEQPLSLHQILTLLLRWAMDYTHSSAGAINLVDAERGEYSLVVFEGYSADLNAMDLQRGTRRTWSWEVGVVGRVARTGQASLLSDVTLDPDYLAVRSDVRSELAVPIRLNGVVLAVLVLDSTQPAGFAASDLCFVQSLADASAYPLQRAIMYQETIEARTQLQQALDNLPTGLALIDLEGVVLRTNAAWYRVWGIAEPESGTAQQHLPWDLLPQILGRLSRPLDLSDFFADGQRDPRAQLKLNIQLDDPPQELLLHSVPVTDTLGLRVGRLIIVEDVTREREIDRLKADFVSIVSHELRTPLTSILGYTEVLLNRDFQREEQREFIQTVYNQALHLSKMVEDLLSISRLEAGQVKLNRWVISMRQIIAELTTQLNEMLTERHRLLINIPDNLPPAYVDRDKVRQILLNLLTNAIKYSPDGGEIVLAVEELRTPPPSAPPLPPERALLISVRDQGLGIAQHELPRVFERFYRVDNSNTRRIGGTGLGLPITKSLVELHGGRIWVESEPGRGSTFYVTLPVAETSHRRE